MADRKIQLKRNNGGTVDNLFPVARIDHIVQSDGTTSFLDNGKIRVSYLPDSVFDSLLFYGTTTGDVAAAGPRLTLAAALIAAKGAADTADRSMIGYYWVITATGTITGLTGIQDTITSNEYATLQFRPQDAGSSGTANTSSGSLEVGDWFVIEKVEGAGTVGSPWVFTASVINNSYELATTAIDGVVRLSSATDTSAMNGSSKVITEDVLFDVIGTAANKIAAGDHLHTGVYEPKNNGLTDLASLFTAGTAGFVKINGVNDASLDTNSYLNASTTSTQSGYFGNIHLQDDTNPSHYLGITVGSDLTAARTLTINTGDADRTVTLGGNLTTNSAISFPSTTTNDILYASSSNTIGAIASTTIGRNTLTIPDIAAISFARYNANETIDMLSASDFRTAIGAGTSSTTGTVTSIATSGAITGGTITTTGTISHSTADGDKHVPATSTTNDRKFLVAGSTAGSFAWEAFPRIYYDTTTGTISGDIIFDEVP